LPLGVFGRAVTKSISRRQPRHIDAMLRAVVKRGVPQASGLFDRGD